MSQTIKIHRINSYKQHLIFDLHERYQSRLLEKKLIKTQELKEK